MTQDVLPLLADAVNELVKARTNREPIYRHDGEKWVRTNHETEVPSLLDQLRNAVEPCCHEPRLLRMTAPAHSRLFDPWGYTSSYKTDHDTATEETG